jgi:hypothetical protein
MKRTMIVGVCLLVAVLIGAPLVMGGQMPMGGQRGEQEQSSRQAPMMDRGMMAMMCPMMDPSGMMGMMSMMGGGQMDPKAMARMLELRGDLLKAMGEVMLKHAKAMEGGQ